MQSIFYFLSLKKLTFLAEGEATPPPMVLIGDKSPKKSIFYARPK